MEAGGAATAVSLLTAKLDLADPFPGHANATANLLECQRRSVLKAESQRDHQAFCCPAGPAS